MMGSKAFESPLISHARMRGLYRGLVELRMLTARAGNGRRPQKHIDACRVSTLIDLQPGDLISEFGPEWVGRWVRDLGARVAARGASSAELKRALKAAAGNERTPFAGSEAHRLLCAVGQAMALKAQRSENLVVAFVAASSLSPAEWNSVLHAANQGKLPLIIVAMVKPKAGDGMDLRVIARKARGPVIPVIPVDAGDAVALYRVAQETSIRARADGGVALIECVQTGTEPIRLLAGQLVGKGICTARWINAVDASLRRAMGQARA